MEGQGVEPLVGKDNYATVCLNAFSVANHLLAPEGVTLQMTQQGPSWFCPDFDKSTGRRFGLTD